MRINKVYKKIQDNNISVLRHNIPGRKGFVIEVDKQYGIFLNHDEINDIDEEFCVAAHEYGHCMSGSTHKINSKFDLICKHEYRADRRAILDFLPIEEIHKAIDAGCQTAYEFSEYLDIPETFVLKAIKHYRCMNLI